MVFDSEGKLLKTKSFYTMKEACNLKGLCLKTAYNNKKLLPNRGQEDGHLGGKRVWTYESLVKWLGKTDESLESTN